MAAEQELEAEVELILHDCFFAVGQAVGRDKRLDPGAGLWWREHYRRKFTYALAVKGNSWLLDRPRVMAVGRYLGLRAVHHAGDSPKITEAAAALASADVERGCRMNAQRESGLPEGAVRSRS